MKGVFRLRAGVAAFGDGMDRDVDVKGTLSDIDVVYVKFGGGK